MPKFGTLPMIGFLQKLWRDPRGNALAIAGAALPLVVGSAGLASDTIQWTLWKRQLQRAADSAAMAGVYARIQSADYAAAVNRDLTHNSHVGITTTVTPNSPPPTGAFATDANAVRVSLAVQKSLSFSSMFMSAAPTITATATATVVPSGTYCVISLENTAATGITATGSASVDMGCGMITNSTSMTAAVATGASAVIASPIAAVGGIQASNNWASGTVLQPFTLAQADPFAEVYPPTSFPNGNPSDIRVNSNQSLNRSSDTGTIYVGDMELNGNVQLGSATYVLDGGDLSIGAQANVSCNGCTFVLTSKTAATNPASIGNVNMNGGATINLTAPSSGTYQGILIYQDRRAVNGNSANQSNTLNGNSDSFFQGAFYFPNQQVTFNGTAGMDTACMQLVGRTVTFSGNMDIDNVCPPASGASAFTGRRVRLVG
jgi:hypothetical protein